MFWKQVMRVMKSEPARDEMIQDVNGYILRDCEVRRWAEYLLHCVEDVVNKYESRGTY